MKTNTTMAVTMQTYITLHVLKKYIRVGRWLAEEVFPELNSKSITGTCCGSHNDDSALTRERSKRIERAAKKQLRHFKATVPVVTCWDDVCAIKYPRR